MSEFITALDGYGQSQARICAFCNSKGERIDYGHLSQDSSALGARVLQLDERRGAPVGVYGHKSPLMLVAFFACVKSGHPYVPLDTSLPEDRLASILDQLEDPLVIDTTGLFPPSLQAHAAHCLPICDPDFFASLGNMKVAADAQVQGEDTFYILFTSGSTGTPKGVEVSAANVDAFLEWMCAAYAFDKPQVFFNRAPFSFDLSVTDLVRGLGGGDTLFALERDAQASLAASFSALAESGTSFWVSTPSFAEACLADPGFGPSLLPELHTFFFVGETLTRETAARLLERFPGCRVVNGYGPTESTVLVAATDITPAMTQSSDALPVGTPKPHVQLAILDPESLEQLPAGTPGELFIVGDTVAKGYYRREDATEAAFASYPYPIPEGMRAYRTGDECMLDESGMLHFRGRYDFQVKLHGYRIELGDIEANLSALPEVHSVCVLPVLRDKTTSFLRAFIRLEEGVPAEYATTRRLKEALGEALPEYMVPRSFVYLESFPLNANGKIDRKALAAREA